MSGGIFEEAAPKFWSLGLKCVPLEPGSKRPAKELKSWQGYLAAVPNEVKRKAWLETYAYNGIGLLMGGEAKPGHVLIGLDVDDDRLVTPVERFLKFKGGLISGKKGKKGATFFVQTPKGTKSTVLKGTEGLGDIDVLAGGKMTVMPPSIHPETLKPYVDHGAPLLETMLDQLPIVTPNELKALGLALGSAEILAILDGKGTHETGLPLAGRLVAKGATDDEITAIITAFLPDGYKGNALDELPGWIESARDKGFDTSGEKQRPTLVETLVNMTFATDCAYFNDGDGTAYVTIPTGEGVLTYAVRSSSFEQWIRHQAFTRLGKPASRNPVSEVIDTLEANALFSSPGLPPEKWPSLK